MACCVKTVSDNVADNSNQARLFVTFHHEMSHNVTNGHFHVFIFSESKFYAIYNGEKPFPTQRTNG